MDLNKFGVRELTTEESQEINGGFFGLDDGVFWACVGIGVAIGFAAYQIRTSR